MGGNEGVGVAWVSNNEHFYGFLGNLIKCFALGFEYLSVSLKQISSLHSWASWSGSDKDSSIAVLESSLWVSCSDNGMEATIGSVQKLHLETLEWAFSSWKLDEMEDYPLIWSKHSSLRNEMAEEGTNLSSSSGDCNSDWC